MRRRVRKNVISSMLIASFETNRSEEMSVWSRISRQVPQHSAEPNCATYFAGKWEEHMIVWGWFYRVGWDEWADESPERCTQKARERYKKSSLSHPSTRARTHTSLYRNGFRVVQLNFIATPSVILATDQPCSHESLTTKVMKHLLVHSFFFES